MRGLAVAKPFVFTLDFYRRARRAHIEGGLLLGEGANLVPPFAGLERVLCRETESRFRSGSLAAYPRPGGDMNDRELLAESLNRLMGHAAFGPEDVLLTHGSTEGLDIVCRHAGEARLACLLPLPAYFQYELAASHHGLPVAGFYGVSGDIHWCASRPSRGPLCLVVNRPDALTGACPQPEFFTALSTGLSVSFAVYDLCFLLLDIDPSAASRSFVRQLAVDTDWERAALLLTLSKDLALPGLRCGLLASRCRPLLEAARDILMERYFAPSPLGYGIMRVYLGLAAGDEIQGLDAFDAEFLREFADHQDNMVLARVRANVAQLAASAEGLLGPPLCPPLSGYSALVQVRGCGSEPEQLLSLTAQVARDTGVNLFLNYVYGGTPEAWRALYRGQVVARVNLSQETPRLAEAVAALQRWRPRRGG